ncbi:HAD family hydrolase [Sphingomonas soli]|uniref:HAD family hydrolase n=1 Tax=Sphingomonas soli TaxID=266127 RepID=UPI00082AD6F8|nr:HAD family phosphatase [Sphingomonas soli]
MEGPSAVIFDVGNVLFPWNPRWLYERLIHDDRALDAFLRDVVTHEWHFQHDAGRPFAETSAELIAQFPEHDSLIRAWGPRFNETLGDPIPGMREIVFELDAAGVPLFGITNFSSEFWRDWAPGHSQIFGRFRDIVVSGDEKLIKPDPAIYRLALSRFGLEPAQAVFIDDNLANVESAARLGIHAIRFTGAELLRTDLRALGLPV